MGNNIQLFEHEKFGKVRVVTIDGEPWFVAADVCRVLELGNSSQAINRLDDDEKRKITENRVVVDPHFNIGSDSREINVVNEPGLYRLVFASRKKEAREFQRWVYHEVLPSIRKTGSYSLTKNTNNNDRDPLAFERERLAFERERLAFERERLAANNSIDLLTKAISELTAVERDRLALEQEKFNVENSEDAMVFKAVKQLIELAALAGDEKYIRAKLVSLATNLLVKGNFIDESDIIFKK